MGDILWDVDYCSTHWCYHDIITSLRVNCDTEQERSRTQTTHRYRHLLILKNKKITYSKSYLHPKLDLWRGKRVCLLAKMLTRAHERSRLVLWTSLVEVHHPLMALMRREVGSGRFSRKKSCRTLAHLIERRSWWAKAHVALARQLLLVVEVVVVHWVGALVIKHVLPWKPCWLCALWVHTRQSKQQQSRQIVLGLFLITL